MNPNRASLLQPRLEPDRHADAELWVVLDLLAVLCPGGRTANRTAFFRFGAAIVGHVVVSLPDN